MTRMAWIEAAKRVGEGAREELRCPKMMTTSWKWNGFRIPAASVASTGCTVRRVVPRTGF